MRFVILVIDDGLTPADAREMKSIDSFNEELSATGRLIMAEGIRSGADATVVDNRESLGLVSRGSHHTDAEQYTGFWIIDADDEAQALEIAKRASRACNRKVELRPNLR